MPPPAGSSGSIAGSDAYGNVANYTGTVHFTSTDGLATLPANYTFTASDYGTVYFTATLRTVGTQSVTVTDTEPVPAGGRTTTFVSLALWIGTVVVPNVTVI